MNDTTICKNTDSLTFSKYLTDDEEAISSIFSEVRQDAKKWQRSVEGDSNEVQSNEYGQIKIEAVVDEERIISKIFD